MEKTNKKSKTTIEIYKAWCKRCGICAAFCPTGVLAQDDSGLAYVKDLEKCTGCRLCELRCPDFAIHVKTPRKEKTQEKTSETTKEEIHDADEKT
jgi:2-oxoglutarate ferredoxin oxidoreductase subunit delta